MGWTMNCLQTKNLNFTEKRKDLESMEMEFVPPYTREFRFNQPGLCICAVWENDTVHFRSTKAQPVPREDGHINYYHITLVAVQH